MAWRVHDIGAHCGCDEDMRMAGVDVHLVEKRTYLSGGPHMPARHGSVNHFAQHRTAVKASIKVILRNWMGSHESI